LIKGPKLSKFKIGDQNCKMVKIEGLKLQLNLKNNEIELLIFSFHISVTQISYFVLQFLFYLFFLKGPFNISLPTTQLKGWETKYLDNR